MAKDQTKEALVRHKDNALKALNTYLEKLIKDPDKKINAKADKLSYWINDWTTFLDFEKHFSPSSLKRYKRGEIIKVHLGYNIGSEEGGLHYAVIVEKDNSIYNPVVTIVPLTSIKQNKDLSHLKNGEVLLGNEIFLKFSAKFTDAFHRTKEEHQQVHEELRQLLEDENISPEHETEIRNKQKIIVTIQHPMSLS